MKPKENNSLRNNSFNTQWVGETVATYCVDYLEFLLMAYDAM